MHSCFLLRICCWICDLGGLFGKDYGRHSFDTTIVEQSLGGGPYPRRVGRTGWETEREIGTLILLARTVCNNDGSFHPSDVVSNRSSALRINVTT